jgi:hypothetical protein
VGGEKDAGESGRGGNLRGGGAGGGVDDARFTFAWRAWRRRRGCASVPSVVGDEATRGGEEKSGARVEGSCAAHRCAVRGFRPATARLGRARVYSYAPRPDGLTLRARGCAALR